MGQGAAARQQRRQPRWPGRSTSRSLGDVEVKGLTGIDRLPKDEKRTIEVSIRPKSPAPSVLRLMLSCKSVASEELVGFESEFELTVE